MSGAALTFLSTMSILLTYEKVREWERDEASAAKGPLPRALYASRRVVRFCDLAMADGRERGDLDPCAQAERVFDSYSTGDSFIRLGQTGKDPCFVKCEPSYPAGPHVWEMRTVDVRIFGWFPADPNSAFVAVEARRKADLVTANGATDRPRYDRIIKAVAWWRATAELHHYVWKGDEHGLRTSLKPNP